MTIIYMFKIGSVKDEIISPLRRENKVIIPKNERFYFFDPGIIS